MPQIQYSEKYYDDVYEYRCARDASARSSGRTRVPGFGSALEFRAARANFFPRGFPTSRPSLDAGLDRCAPSRARPDVDGSRSSPSFGVDIAGSGDSTSARRARFPVARGDRL